THGPGVRQCLKPRGNVHTVAEEVSSAYHYVSDVDTDAEEYAAIRCETGVRFGQSGLCLHRALHRVRRATKFSQNAIARRVRDASPVFTNDPVEDGSALSKPTERADLVSAHEATVALHICCEDGHEASADFRRV